MNIPSRRRALRRSLVIAGLLGVLLFFLVFRLSQPFVNAAEDSSAPAVSADRLREDVKKLTVEFFPRDSRHPEVLDRAAAWITSELSATGATVSEHEFVHGEARYRNIVAAYGPLTEELIVVGAHYDAAGELPGADDNASGLASLLAIARALKDQKLHTRVQLVAFTLEERSHVNQAALFGVTKDGAPKPVTTALNGSRAYARKLKADGSKVRAMLSLEMLGCYSDEAGSQRFPVSILGLLYPTTGNYLVVVGELSGQALVRDVKSGYLGSGSTLPLRSINAPRAIPGIDYSDHASFWEQGYPAVMFTDTAFYRNPRYHKAEDTWDTLDYQRMSEAVRGIFGAVVRLARK